MKDETLHIVVHDKPYYSMPAGRQTARRAIDQGQPGGYHLIKNNMGEKRSVQEKTIGELVGCLETGDLRGRKDTPIRGVAYDSRRVQAGDLFVALRGLHTDGHRFVDQALDRGAVAVLHEAALCSYREQVGYLQVPDSRRAMAALAAEIYGQPSRELSVIGVTGTDGKSTTVWLIHQLLEKLGSPSGFISTVQMKTRCAVQINPLRQSTPEAPDIQALLRQMVEAGKRYAVIEATSHGLSSQTLRLAHVEFDAAVCTNISHEHLEFHGSFEQYRSDKANLFRAVSGRVAVINRDDPSHDYLAAQTDAPVACYSLKSSDADLFAADVQADLTGSRFTLCYGNQRQRVESKLPGMYNVENLLAAGLTVLRLQSLSLADLASRIPDLEGVAGRMQIITAGQPFTAIVDYAHTPQSFAKILPLVKTATEGRLIAVFGSAGERDVEKRPLQGEVAARYCDILVLSDEDPRGESSQKILEEIAAGCRRQRGQLERNEDLFLIPDRAEGIRRALSLARPGDTVLLLGKGHEQSIIYEHGPQPWDEAQAARRILAELGWKR